jgi:hypothetical protein
MFSISKHFTVRTTYNELQSSTKVISQGNLTSDGDIFFTVHTADLQHSQCYTTVST